jgi:hypothetical protein
MNFIQLDRIPENGIPSLDGYCFGKFVEYNQAHMCDLYKFRDHPLSNQNNGRGWFTGTGTNILFKLELMW